ncbi:hypothetical protein LTR53_015432 [Teratosphaeriaceae sp. CCFEE 6253]|nr:hypothetical protein LTR53_015432 [Teratosphaeriaceae sp. CCFEE 6253]
MGKRKKSSRTPVGPKKREALQTNFKCPFCNHESSVTISIDKKNYIGMVDCRNCLLHYQSSSDMRALMQPVDVYYEWIDACEDVNPAGQGAGGHAGDAPAASRARPGAAATAGSRTGLAPGGKYTEEDRGFIDDADDVDAEDEFEDE